MYKPADIPALLESAWLMRDEIVPCLIGAPGIGKTQGVYQFAESKGANVVEIIASQILPNEVSGITMPVDGTHSMEIYDHARLASLRDGDILFFDELLQAPEQTLAACLTLIQERRLLSGKKLPDVMIVAACNPIGSPQRIPLSIRQRFMWFDIAFDIDQWINYEIARHPDLDPMNFEGVGVKLTVEDEKGNWNVLTPRSASKLIDWGCAVKTNKNLYEAWSKSIKEMYGSTTRIKFENLIPCEVFSHFDMLKQKLMENNWDLRHIGGFDVESIKSPKELLEAIKRLPEAEREEVEEYLKGCDMDEVH